jgi:hypothetical protein
MFTATLLKTDGTTEAVGFPGGRGTLERLHEAVGGYIETVQARGGTLIVNEDGLRLELPYNAQASVLAGQRIVGDALLFAPGEFKRLDDTLD